MPPELHLYFVSAGIRSSPGPRDLASEGGHYDLDLLFREAYEAMLGSPLRCVKGWLIWVRTAYRFGNDKGSAAKHLLAPRHVRHSDRVGSVMARNFLCAKVFGLLSTT